MPEAKNNYHLCHTKYYVKATAEGNKFGIYTSPVITVEPYHPQPSFLEDMIIWMSVWRVGHPCPLSSLVLVGGQNLIPTLAHMGNHAEMCFVLTSVTHGPQTSKS